MAISADPEMAAAVGANTTWYAVVAFGLGGLLAGVAGVLVGPITYANPYLGDTYGIVGFVALMIGGVEKPAAAMGGGLVLGVLSVAANTYIGSQASDWFPFVVVIVVLLIAPHGLFASGNPRQALDPSYRRAFHDDIGGGTAMRAIAVGRGVHASDSGRGSRRSPPR